MTFTPNFINQSQNSITHTPGIFIYLQSVKEAFSISLALLMLVSNVGFSLNTHFCGGEVVKSSFTIGLHNPDCEMANMDNTCDRNPSKEHQLAQKPCCENQHQIVQLDENATTELASININPVFVAAFIHVFVQPLVFADQALTTFVDYSAPLTDKDIQVLFQTFLI